MSAELLGVVFAVAGAAAALLSVRAGAAWAGRLAVLLVALPVAGVVLDGEFRIFSHHGFLHASYVEAILERGLPPTDPLLAGGALGYAWVHHAIIALLVSITGAHSSIVFAVTDVVLAAACAALLVIIARRVFAAAGAMVLAPLLALYGASPFPRGLLAKALDAGLGIDPEGRLIPIQKFASVNSNQLGILCFVWGLYALVRLTGAQDRARVAAAAHLFAATALAALLYPLCWAPLVATAALTGLALSVRHGDIRAAALPWGATGLASLCTAPYLWSLQRGKGTAALVLDPSWTHVSSGLLQLALVLGPPLLLLAWLRRANGGHEPAADGAGLVFGAAGLVGVVLFLLVSAGMGSEYKFLALAGLVAGFALGGALAPLAVRRPSATALLVALLLLPASSFFARAILVPWGDTAAVHVAGRRLEAVDPDRRALHAWLCASTPPDAVFVDTALDLPVYTGRSLYVALDPPRGGVAPGWGVVPSVYLTTVVGHPAALLRERTRISRRLLRGEVSAEELEVLARDLGDAPVYVVARGPRARGHLRVAPRFKEAFASGSLGVYSLQR